MQNNITSLRTAKTLFVNQPSVTVRPMASVTVWRNGSDVPCKLKAFDTNVDALLTMVKAKRDGVHSFDGNGVDRGLAIDSVRLNIPAAVLFDGGEDVFIREDGTVNSIQVYILNTKPRKVAEETDAPAETAIQPSDIPF